MRHLFKHFAFSLLLFFFISLNSAISQVHRFEFDRISIDQGLSQSTVYCILQDHIGYMWFATEDGLNRYDGFNFKVYFNDTQDLNSISSNRIMTLLEDSNHNLWVGTLGGGLNKFNRFDDNFTIYKHLPNNPESLGSDIVMSICEDSNQKIWVGTAGGGVSVLDQNTQTFKTYSNNSNISNSLFGNLVRSLYYSANDSLVFLGTDKGLCIYDSHTDGFIHIKDILNTDLPEFSRTVISITGDTNGNIWIAIDDNGVVKISIKDRKFSLFTTHKNSALRLASNSVLSITEDSQGFIWFATYAGLQMFDPHKNTSFIFTNRSTDPFSLSSNLIRYVYEDKTGIIWVGTYRDGINKSNSKYSKFSVYRNNISSTGGLPPSSIRALYEESDGTILIGTYGHGLIAINPLNDSIILNPYNLSPSIDLRFSQITSIVSDTENNIWIGFDGGLRKFNKKTRTTTNYLHNRLDPGSIASNRIRCLLVDHKGTLWVGTTGDGLCKYIKETNSFVNYRPGNKEEDESLSQERILCLFEDSFRNIWVGTSNEGLNQFDPETAKATHYKNNPNDSKSISSDRILCVFQDSKGRLWIGTGGGGLNLFDYESKSFKAFRKQDGLPNDVIYGIAESRDGALWLSTNYGLSRFVLDANQKPIVRNFTKTDGLQSNEFTEGAYLSLRSGSHAFGGIGGLNIFDPLKVVDNPFAPYVVIESVTLFNNKGKTGKRMVQQINSLNSSVITIPFSQNNINFSFIALHFQNPLGNNYLYRLEGFEKEWVSPVVGQRFATYTNLSPGKYTFSVIASNSDGVWNNDGDSIEIVILPPFWRTWWFILIVVVSLIGLMVLFIKLREAGLIQMQKELEEKVNERTKEIVLQKEEIESQRDFLSQLNAELQQKNEEITAQRDELEKTQNHLVQSEKMASIGLLTAGIAHEINNPVNFVYAGVGSITKDFDDLNHVLQVIKTIEDSNQDPKEIIDLIIKLKDEYEFDEAHEAIIQTLKDIKLGAERTAEIVEGLRNFSRTENEEWNLSNLHRIIDGVLVLLKNKYKRHIEIIKNYDENLSEIECKTGKINQVFMNILSNAIDAIEEHGSITITTKMDSKNCKISVTDTGKGMDDFVMSKIFDPFFTTKEIGKGVGLGLSITYGIIQEHGGTISVKSKIGHGTDFIISLPLKQVS